MPFNGSGGFSPLAPPNFPAVAGTTIVSAYYNNVLNDVMSGLGQCVTRSGQSPWTANLPAGGFKLTGLGAPTTTGDALSFGNTATVASMTVTGNLGVTGTTGLTGDTTISGNLGVGIAPGNLGAALGLSTANGIVQTINSTHVNGPYIGFYKSGSALGYIGSGPQLDGGAITDFVIRGETGAVVLSTTATPRLSIAAAGQVTIAPPNAGTTLTINSVTGGQVAYNCVSGASTGDYALGLYTGLAVVGFVGAGNSAVANVALRNAMGFGTQTAHDVVILANNTEYFRMTGANGSIGLGRVPLSSVRLDILGANNSAGYGANTDLRVVSNNLAQGVVYGWNQIAGVGGDLLIGAGGTQTLTLKSGTQVLDITGGSGKLTMAGAITRFESAIQTVAAAMILSVAHGGPRKPDMHRAVLRCATAELGYSIGDEVDIQGFVQSGSLVSCALWTNATNVGLTSTGAGFICQKSTNAFAAITNANWKVVFYCIWL